MTFLIGAIHQIKRCNTSHLKHLHPNWQVDPLDRLPHLVFDIYTGSEIGLAIGFAR